MKVVKRIDNIEKYSVLFNSDYLKTFNAVEKVSYFVEDDLILPFIVRKRYIFRWIELVVEVYGTNSEEEELAFLNKVVKYVEEEMSVSHILTTNSAVFKNHPTNSLFCKFGSYKVDLSLSEEELFANLHGKHRNVIRRAQKDGLEVSTGHCYSDDIIDLMNDTYSRQGKINNINKDYINRLVKLGDKVEYWIVKTKDSKPQGGAILFWNKGNSCYYIHAGSAQRPSSGAMNLLIWEAMISMKTKGVKYFDFVGARITTETGGKLEGIQRFKSRFGAKLHEGYSFIVIINKVTYRIYKAMMRLAFFIKGSKYQGTIVEQEIKKGNF